MFIDFNDMSEEGQTELIDFAEAKGVSVPEIVEEFNELASDVLDFLDSDDFLEQMLRDDSALLEDYLLFISAMVQKDACRELVRRKH